MEEKAKGGGKRRRRGERQTLLKHGKKGGKRCFKSRGKALHYFGPIGLHDLHHVVDVAFHVCSHDFFGADVGIRGSKSVEKFASVFACLCAPN